MQLITKKFTIYVEMLKSATKNHKFYTIQLRHKKELGDIIIYAFRIEYQQFFSIGEYILISLTLNATLSLKLLILGI